jgi:hypothetical protein
LIVLLGTNDTSTVDSNLPSSAPARAQGSCRYEKGHNFFQAGDSIARKLACDFNWNIVDVQGVDHSSKKMVYGQNENYSISNIPESCGYSILFEDSENHFNSNIEWSDLTDNWHYNDTNLVGRTLDNIFILSKNSNPYNEYVYTADLRFRKGIANIILCSQTKNPAEGSYVIQLNSGNNILRFFDFKDEHLFSATSINPPDDSRTYHIEAVIEGTIITVKINGIQYINMDVKSTQRLYSNGYSGVGVSKGTARFSNVFLRSCSTTAIEHVPDYGRKIIDIRYYRLTGQEVPETASGILIKKTAYGNKSIKIEKIVNEKK